MNHISNVTPVVGLVSDTMTVLEPYSPSTMGHKELQLELEQAVLLPEALESASSSQTASSTAISVASSCIRTYTGSGASSHSKSSQKQKVARATGADVIHPLATRRMRLLIHGLSGPLPSITEGLPLSGRPGETQLPQLIDISTTEKCSDFCRTILARTITNIMVCKMIGSPNAFPSNRRPAIAPSDVDKTGFRDVAMTPSQRLYSESFYAAKFRLQSLILASEAAIPSKYNSYDSVIFA